MAMTQPSPLSAHSAAPTGPGTSRRAWLSPSVLLPAALLAVLLISFQPFGAADVIRPAAGSGGDVVNQLGYSMLGMVALAGMLMFGVPQRVMRAVDPIWVVVVLVLAASCLHSPDPSSSLKSLIFTVLVVLTCVATLVIPQNEDELRLAFLFGVGSALALSYFGVFFLPSLSIHSADAVSYQHAGLWRGHFSHKNVAGPAVANFIFFGIYFMRSGYRVIGALVAVLAMIFVINTGSKTTIGFLPLVIGIVLLGPIFGLRWVIVIVSVITMAVVGAITIGTALSKPLAELAAAISSDPTYTGRITLWNFGIEYIGKQFWTGYGYDGFWLKPVVLNTGLPFDAAWDIREIVHGHNNYMDMILALGFPAGVFVIWVLCLRPFGHYLRCALRPSGRPLAELFLMIVLFSALNSQLEAFWFRRADPVWIQTVFGIYGLYVAAAIGFGSPYRPPIWLDRFQAKAQTSSA
jgi:O-antigen ligase